VAGQHRSRIGVDPTVVPTEQRDVVRRFRGRLAAPVTIWTANDEDGERYGLTVSSVLVAEGKPARVLGLLGDLTDVWEAIRATSRFIVHVVGEGEARVADDFAGRRPGPDAPFNDLDTMDAGWGPEIARFGTRARCTLETATEVGYSLLVQGRIEEITVDGSSGWPLVHHRGAYTTVAR
jgi:3-hydroxy-9,10-secoandrosta-1,3,5(10)-triene-9,17-dione monooxygenase reductase component